MHKHEILSYRERVTFLVSHLYHSEIWNIILTVFFHLTFSLVGKRHGTERNKYEHKLGCVAWYTHQWQTAWEFRRTVVGESGQTNKRFLMRTTFTGKTRLIFSLETRKTKLSISSRCFYTFFNLRPNYLISWINL